MKKSKTVVRHRPSAYLKHADHQRVWRIIEGAVADACKMHPEYLTEQGRACMVPSVTKRVLGALVGSGTLRGGRDSGC